MSALWKVGTVDVYVTDEDISRELKRAELFTLDSTVSIYHFFGSGSEKRALKGKVIGEANRAAIIAYAIGDTAFTLVTPWSNVANVKINGSPKFTAVKYSGGVIDGTTLSVSVTPVFDFELELILP